MIMVARCGSVVELVTFCLGPHTQVILLGNCVKDCIVLVFSPVHLFLQKDRIMITMVKQNCRTQKQQAESILVSDNCPFSNHFEAIIFVD